MLFVHYEDMLKNNTAIVHEVAKLLRCTLTNDEIDAVVDQASFHKMREKGIASYVKDAEFCDEAVSPYFQKGTKGDWHDYFSEEQAKYVDSYVEAHALPVGLSYTY